MTGKRFGIILSYISILFHFIINLILVKLLINILGDSEYGLYQLIGSLISYFAIMDFGLSSTVVRFYSESIARGDIKEQENVLAIAKRIYAIITVIAVFCGVILLPNLGIFFKSLIPSELAEAKIIFIILIINIIIALNGNIYNSILNTYEKFSISKLASIAVDFSQVIILLILLKIFPSAITVVLIQTLLNIIVVIYKKFYCDFILKISIKYHYFNQILIKKIIKFSFNVFVVSLIDQVFWKTDQMILGYFRTTVEIALYSVGSTIYLNFMPLSTSIQAVFLPQFCREIAINPHKNFTKEFIEIGLIQCLVLSLFLFGFILVGKDFIVLWVGENYLPAYYIVLIILPPFFVDLIQNTGLAILQAKNIYNLKLLSYSIAVILNVILTILLCPIYGAFGCAIGSSISMIVCNVFLMNYIYKERLKINISLYWKNILKIMALPAMFCAVFEIMMRSLPLGDLFTLFVKGAAFVVFYLIYLYLLRHKIYSIVKKWR